MAHQFHRELEVACTAVQLCATLTRRVQKESLSPDSTVKKWDFSPVTICDFAVQALLTTATRGEFKSDAFLAEESADELRQNDTLLEQVWDLVESVCPAFSGTQPPLQTPETKEDILASVDLGGKNQQSNGSRTWVFDPIDGTVTFLRGQQYAINCAFLVDGREEIAVIGCPNLTLNSSTVNEDEVDSNGLGLMIFAIRGKGTWVRPMQDSGELAPATKLERHGDVATMDRLLWTDCSTYTSTIVHLQQQVAGRLGIPWPGVDLYSSLMKYAALGLGRAHVCIRIFKYGSWKSNMYVQDRTYYILGKRGLLTQAMHQVGPRRRRPHLRRSWRQSHRSRWHSNRLQYWEEDV